MERKCIIKRSLSRLNFNYYNMSMQCIKELINKQKHTKDFVPQNIINNFRKDDINYYSKDVLLELKQLSETDINNIIKKSVNYDFDYLLNFLFVVMENNNHINYVFFKYCHDKYIMSLYDKTHYEFKEFFKPKVKLFEKYLLIKHIEFLAEYKDKNTINFLTKSIYINKIEGKKEEDLFKFDILKNLNMDDLYIINNNLLVNKKISNSIYEIHNIHENLEQQIILDNLKLCNNDTDVLTKYNGHRISLK